MARFSGVKPDEMTPEQQALSSLISNGPRGHASGMMALWLHHPALTERTQKVGEFLRFKGLLPGDVREMIILIVAEAWRCNHEWYVHAPIAIKEGLDPAIIEAIHQGVTPAFHDQAQRAAYHYVRAMLQENRVSDQQLADLRAAFGLAGVIEVAALIGHYIIGAATLNACQYDLPEGVKPPFGPY